MSILTRLSLWNSDVLGRYRKTSECHANAWQVVIRSKVGSSNWPLQVGFDGVRSNSRLLGTRIA